MGGCISKGKEDPNKPNKNVEDDNEETIEEQKEEIHAKPPNTVDVTVSPGSRVFYESELTFVRNLHESRDEECKLMSYGFNTMAIRKLKRRGWSQTCWREMKTPRHPNWLEVYGVLFASPEESQRGSEIGLAMEYMPGRSLDNVIHGGRGENLIEYDISHVLSWTKQAALGLNFLHEKKIIHRDVRPENMLLNEDHTILKLTNLDKSTVFKDRHTLLSTMSHKLSILLEQHIESTHAEAIVIPIEKAYTTDNYYSTRIEKEIGNGMKNHLKSIARTTKLKTGSALITPSFQMKNCQKVIHVVCPVIQRLIKICRYKEFQLHLAYVNALTVAEEAGLKTVAIPLLSVATKHYPAEEGFCMAMQSIIVYFELHPESIISEVFLVDKGHSKMIKKYVSEDTVLELSTKEQCSKLRHSIGAMCMQFIGRGEVCSYPCLGKEILLDSFVKKWYSQNERNVVFQAPVEPTRIDFGTSELPSTSKQAPVVHKGSRGKKESTESEKGCSQRTDLHDGKESSLESTSPESNMARMDSDTVTFPAVRKKKRRKRDLTLPLANLNMTDSDTETVPEVRKKRRKKQESTPKKRNAKEKSNSSSDHYSHTDQLKTNKQEYDLQYRMHYVDESNAERQKRQRKNNFESCSIDSDNAKSNRNVPKKSGGEKRQNSPEVYSPTDQCKLNKQEYDLQQRLKYNDETHAIRQKRQREKKQESSSPDSDSDNCEVEPPKVLQPLYLGRMTNECVYCGALHFPGEHYCCGKGRVFVPPFPKLPETINSLFFDIRNKQRPEFLKNIIQYNTCFSFASIQYHRSPVALHGAQVAKTQGPIRHFPSAALPGKYMGFGNFYLLEDSEAVEKRLEHPLYSGLKQKTVADITACLTLFNCFSTMYKSMGECLEEARKMGNNPDHLRMKIIDARSVDKKLLNSNHPGIYRTAVHHDDFVSVLYDSSIEQEVRYPGLIIYPKHSSRPTRPLFPWMKEVTPLCYPLLFPHGEPGWSFGAFPVETNKKLTFKERLRNYATTHRKESELWESDDEMQDVYYTASESDPNLEESDEETDENVDETYYDTQISVNTVVNEPEKSSGLNFVERNGELYPARNSTDHIKCRAHLIDAVEMDADLDIDSGLSAPENEETMAGIHDTEVNESTTSSSKNQGPEDGSSDVDETSSSKLFEKHHRKSISCAEYSLFILQKRKRFRNRISAARKLGQLLTIDNMTRVRHGRTEFTRKHNTQYLTSPKKKYLEAFQKKADRSGVLIGSITSVPSTVPGSPRNLEQLFENTVCLNNLEGKPDIFATVTCNVMWREIQENLEPGTTWADNPCLVNEVFKKKLDKFLDKTLGKRVKPNSQKRRGGLFGPIRWYTLSIEFQSRGPPHAHIIISLKRHIRTASEVDRFCQAELPVRPDPSDPEYERIARIRQLIEDFMIHTPCENDSEAYCQKNKPSHWTECLKHFPKKWNGQTYLDDRQYAQLRRRNNGETCVKHRDGRELVADNRYVIAHNTELLSMFECHINIEIVSSLRVMKYIFKYLFKGCDRALVEAVTSNSDLINPYQMTMDGHLFYPSSLKIPKGVLEERKQEAIARLQKENVPLFDEKGKPVVVCDETYMIEDMRTTTACEAAWDLMKLPRHMCSHTVVTVFVHCPNEELIKTEFSEEAQEREFKKLLEEDVSSRLKAWFLLNQSSTEQDQEAKTMTFDKIPTKFVYEKGKWRFRKRDISKHTVGRIKSVSPRNLEQFAIRLLASTVIGPRSFEELRTFNEEVFPTFADACRARGLMNDEREWHAALDEAAQDQMPLQLRRMFISIMLFCAPANPRELWECHKEQLYDRRTWSDEKKEAHALYHIQTGLRSHGSSLSILGLPEVNMSLLPFAAELIDDSQFPAMTIGESKKVGDTYQKQLNEEQQAVFNSVITSLESDCFDPFFIEGSGGSGKTFVYKALFHTLTGMGYQVLSVAHTGIAAILLPNGATAHRTFCIPLTTEEGMHCKVELETKLADDIRNVNVVLWDESPMTDYRILEAVDELFRNLHPESCSLPFGGVLFVFGGDFKQTLPIVLGVKPAAVVNYTILRMDWWNKVKILHLYSNIRAHADQAFAKWLYNIGTGKANLDVTIPESDQEIEFPPNILVRTERELINAIFGNKKIETSQADLSAILTIDNKTSLEINEKVLKMLPGETHTFSSIDTYDKDRGFAQLDSEYYNTLTPAGMPPHELHLKVGATVILLRNMAVNLSLCNGTRMKIKKIQRNVLTCYPIGKPNKIVYLHRWLLTTSSVPTRELSFIRRQFPIRLAYALTVNKAQGQTFNQVGLLLRSPVFAHGQLYVALSRVRSSNNLLVYNSNKANKQRTTNVVFRNALI